MRLNKLVLLLSTAALLRAQGPDFAICQGYGPEILRQSPASPQTEFCIGYLYGFGRGVPKDMVTAVTHYRAAAERGYTPAQAVLGVDYARGLGVAQNWAEALRWYRKAAEGGHAGAAANLGYCLQYGKGVQQNRNEAAKWYRFAADHGNTRAAGMLAEMRGVASSPQPPPGGGPPEHATGYKGQGQQNPGSWLRYRVPPERVRQLVREVAGCWTPEPGIVSCNRPLTGNYGQTEIRAAAAPANGSQAPETFPIPATPPPMGVPPGQRADAEKLWQQADALLKGNNARAAMPVLYKCALMGDRRAEATLGIRYQDGDGVKADDHTAAYWFGLAVAQNHRASQYALGGMYEEGEGGLPKDQAKATALYIKSANQGFDKAQLALGVCYEFGEGVPRDRAKAIALIRQSGLAPEIADVLANPRAPKSFASEDAFGAYLATLRNAQIAASWAQAHPARSSSGFRTDPYFDHNSTYWREQRRGDPGSPNH